MFKSRVSREGSCLEMRQGRGQNRTWEIRPSGIAGRLQETSYRAELGTHAATERATVVTLRLSAGAPEIYPDRKAYTWEGFMQALAWVDWPQARLRKDLNPCRRAEAY